MGEKTLSIIKMCIGKWLFIKGNNFLTMFLQHFSLGSHIYLILSVQRRRTDRWFASAPTESGETCEDARNCRRYQAEDERGRDAKTHWRSLESLDQGRNCLWCHSWIVLCLQTFLLNRTFRVMAKNGAATFDHLLLLVLSINVTHSH